ncbi:MAG: FG-GAP-like repeat-containing protein [Casimicrobiaceae bacterium]
MICRALTTWAAGLPRIALWLVALTLLCLPCAALAQAFTSAVNYATGLYPAALATGDFNGDGMQDVAVINVSSGSVSIFLGQGDGTLQAAAATLPTGVYASRIAVGDFNGDGKTDLAVTNIGSNTVGIYLGNGNGTFRAPTFVAAGLAPLGLAVADLNGDGRQDLVVTNASSGATAGQTLSVLLNNGDGSFAPMRAYATGVNPGAVTIADVNSDGKPDLIVANYSDGTISVLLGNGDGTFAPRLTYATGFRPNLVRAVDLNRDGKLDLVVVNSFGISIMLGRGDGTFATVVNISLGITPAGLAIGDFNGDGIVDIATGNIFSNNVFVLLGTGAGGFQPAATYATAAGPTAVETASLRGNGALDLISANRSVNTISVLLNTLPGASPASLVNRSGSPQSAMIGSSYATQLSVLVRDATNRPLPGIAVTFTAPASGASGIFAGGQTTARVQADALGIAIAPMLTANATAGSFAISAAAGVASSDFALTNVGGSMPPAFTSSPPPGGQAGVTYSFSVRASGLPPPTYALTAGNLPPGLGLNATSGLISGAPSSAETYAGTIMASNGNDPPATQPFSMIIAQLAQTINFGAMANRALGTPPFALSPSSSSGLAVTLSSLTASVCTVAGNLVTLVAVGNCTIRAAQSGNASYAPAPNVDQSFAITGALLAQTINFPALANRQLGTLPLGLYATASSGLTVAFTSLTPAYCTLVNNSVVLLAVGTCTIRASQPGNPTYAAAANVDQSFSVLSNLAAQTVTFGALANRNLGTLPFNVSASSSSALPVAFSSLTTATCTVSGNTVTLVAAGACTIRAAQAGNVTYAAAPNVDQSFVVSAQASQVISFAAPPNRAFGAPPSVLSAISTSGLAVGFASQSPTVCIVNGTTVTVIAVGACTIRASQSGNSAYLPAPNVDRTFTVNAAAQGINFPTVPSRALDSGPFEMRASASSGLAVSYAAVTSAICKVNDQWLAPLAVGTCTVRASQAGNANYFAAPSVDQTISVVAASQSLLFAQPAPQSLLRPQFEPHASASSGLPVTFSSLTPPTCTISGGVATMIAAGTCTLRATQAGNATFAAVTGDRSFQVSTGAVASTDPVPAGPMLEYSTILGGFNSGGTGDKAFDVVVAPDGSAYVGGSVAGTYFPGISAATFANGGLDLLYVAKLNPDLGRIDIATVVGARSADMTGTGVMPYVGPDQVEALAISPNGVVYAAAYANSTNYPLTGGTYLRTGAKLIHRVGADGAVQPLSPIVDPAVRTIRALAVDAAGGIYITGVAGPGLATTPNAAIAASSAMVGGPYLIKFAAGSGAIAYATYLSVGGSRNSIAPDPHRSLIDNATTAYALAVDSAGNAYVAGQAGASDFPATPGAPDTTDSQNRDAFVAKVNPIGSALLWTARLGGSDAERATSIALAPDGGVVVGGKTATLTLNSVGTVFQTGLLYNMHPDDREIGFVAKLAPDGSRWLFVIPIGSAGGNLVRDAYDQDPSPVRVALDLSGAILVAGNTAVDRELPVGSWSWGDLEPTPIQSPGYYNSAAPTERNAPASIYRRGGAFLMKMTPDGRDLVYSVIVNSGRATGLAVDAYGAAYVAGFGAGAPQVNAAQASPGKVFVAKVLSQSAPLSMTAAPNPSVSGAGVTLTASLADRRYSGSIEFRDGGQVLAAVPLVNGAAAYTTALGIGIHRVIATFVGAGPFNGMQAPEVIQVVNQQGTGP